MNKINTNLQTLDARMQGALPTIPENIYSDLLQGLEDKNWFIFVATRLGKIAAIKFGRLQ